MGIAIKEQHWSNHDNSCHIRVLPVVFIDTDIDVLDVQFWYSMTSNNISFIHVVDLFLPASGKSVHLSTIHNQTMSDGKTNLPDDTYTIT